MKTIQEQLAEQGLRLANANQGEPGWFALVYDANNRVIKVWATCTDASEFSTTRYNGKEGY